jgi:hypothetical protein
MESDWETDTSFGSEPHGAITRRKPTLQELITGLSEDHEETARLAMHWVGIMRETFPEPDFKMTIESGEVADILHDTDALLVKVVCLKGNPVPPTPVFYLLVASSRHKDPEYFAQQPDHEFEHEIHAQNKILRTLRVMIHTDQDQSRENQFAWCAVAAANHIRFWRYNVYGPDDQIDRFGEPMLGARFTLSVGWQGAARKVEAEEGKWVRDALPDGHSRLRWVKWRSFEHKVAGANYLRYIRHELTDDMHPVEQLHRPHLTVGRYRTMRPAFPHVAMMGCDFEQDVKFLNYWFYSVKTQFARLASGEHVTIREANSYLDTFFLVDIVDEDLSGTPHDMI